jgi:hypothetical protein
VDPHEREDTVLPAVLVLLNERPADMQEYQKKAFDFAADLTKQLITLSTSIVTVSLLFGEHFPKQSPTCCLGLDVLSCFFRIRIMDSDGSDRNFGRTAVTQAQ